MIYFIIAVIMIGSGYFKHRMKLPFWPTKADWTFFVIGSAGMAVVQVLLGMVSAPWLVAWAVGFILISLVAVVSSCIAWAIGKGREVLNRYSQVCPQCDSKEVLNEEFTDIFDYGCENGCVARLAAKSVKHHCCNCGFDYTGYQNEEDRAKAVKNFLNR